ncbi:pyruvate kinase [Gordonia sp. HNM0687]|uniref:pyruvate kinase n=1 Tax=Gordonia mangrovi TaxID=2665643 RepID=A0A6L7GML1_9ACTN|nr:pyruvate kinase [Gordonia mangrovi]MXP20431.1 pyruvate kinase [Gordonia mangrovi]UVF78971.1 pyruvate kinase [Gordonia mangrovi]
MEAGGPATEGPDLGGVDEDRRERLTALRAQLVDLRDDARKAESVTADRIAAVHPAHRAGAANLVHYRAMRAHDLRDLQNQLTAEGLSSLGRMESGVLTNLNAVIRIIDEVLGGHGPGVEPLGVDSEAGPEILERNAFALLGPQPHARSARVMVTMPGIAAADPGFVERCSEAGMDLARINCAHDNAAAWRTMATHVRAADPEIRIAMDLGGPKVRTGPIKDGPKVVRIRPKRDQLGRVTTPARFWLGRAPDGADMQTTIPIDDPAWPPSSVTTGAHITLTDARGRARTLVVEETAPHGALVSCDRTLYLTPGTLLHPDAGDAGDAVVGDLPALAQALLLRPGDTVTLTADLSPATPTDDGNHHIGCTLAEAFSAVAVGDRVFFDDGKIAGAVTDVSAEEIAVLVTRAKPEGTKLKAEKGINLPDTRLPTSALTADDVAALDTVVEIADVVNLSFVQGPQDVAELQRILAERHSPDLGIVLKVETVAGFEALPQSLLQAMRTRRVGVMIARGDLAVETGFERLAEVQEEILWLCEAAHVPVIWATQVLDSLADRGLPTRAEVTDAAAGERAECVMLNKGPHIVEAIEALTEILSRMRGHVDKKRTLLRRLGAWDEDRRPLIG